MTCCSHLLNRPLAAGTLNVILDRLHQLDSEVAGVRKELNEIQAELLDRTEMSAERSQLLLEFWREHIELSKMLNMQRARLEEALSAGPAVGRLT